MQQGSSLLAAFFQLLDEESVIDRGGRNSSVTVMTYWAIGDEAAYHLAGLFVGDERGEAYTELCGYLDFRLRRFDKVVEMWEMEMAWDKEDGE